MLSPDYSKRNTLFCFFCPKKFGTKTLISPNMANKYSAIISHMKNGHTIFFNISACNKYGLGPTDAYILDWIYRFAHSGKMYNIRHREETTGKILTYYWVCYDKLIRDFCGFLKFRSTHNLRLQYINRYVTSGILYKFVYTVPRSDSAVQHIPALSDGQHLAPGSYTFFAINEKIYLELMGETDTEDVQFCMPVPDNHVHPSPDKNVRPNITTLSNNNTTTTCDAETSNNSDTVSEIKNHIKDLFKDKSYLQGNDFAHNLIDQMTDNGITDIQDQKDYISWVFRYSQNRANKRLSSYFRSVACNADLMKEFLGERDKGRTKDALKTKSNTTRCPVCNTHHYIGSTCPECGLIDAADTVQVTRLINIRKLPTHKQVQLNRRIDNLYKGCSLSDMGAILSIQRKKEEIYAEYGV